MKRGFFKIQSTRTITILYVLLLIYTVAQLIYWGILLKDQSREITLFRKENLRLKTDSLSMPVKYDLQLQKINQEEQLRTFQYWGEGVTFLVILLFGSSFVYGAARKQIRLSRQQNNFMMAVTHELKSPIAVAKLNLETLLKRKLDEEKQFKLIENTINETNRLNHLCNNMLLASQFETRQYHIVKETVDLSTIVNQAIAENKNRAVNHKITEQVQPGVWIKGDVLMLGIAINNLVENALKYSPKNTVIEVKLFAIEHRVVLQVADEGSGIPAVEKEKIFTRFYRIGNENTRKAKGTGLGLYLTQKIVQQHNGKIQVLDKQPNGSIFEITLPLITNTAG